MNKIICILTVVLAAAPLFSCTESQASDVAPSIPVKVQTVQGQTQLGTLRYSASIRPASQMELAFRNGGFVDSILRVSGHTLDQGDAVAKGTILASLRRADFQHRLDQLNSQLMEAHSALESARSRADDARARAEKADFDFARAESLFNSKSLIRSSYDAAKAERDSAMARLESAKADIEASQARVWAGEAGVADAVLALQDSAIVAPMTGTIVDRSVEEGGLVAAGRTAFVLSDTRTVKAVFGVPDLEIQAVRLGMTLDVRSEAVPDTVFSGRVTSIAPAADERSRIFETEVSIPNQNGVLRAGMIASVEIGKTGMPQAVPAVPLSSITHFSDQADSYAVFVVESHDSHFVARRRVISLGEPVGNMVAVTDGLSIGETVISIGSTLVRDGDAVQIVP